MLQVITLELLVWDFPPRINKVSCYRILTYNNARSTIFSSECGGIEKYSSKLKLYLR